MHDSKNLSKTSKVIKDFGNEWVLYNQTEMSQEEIRDQFNTYFGIFNLNTLPKNANIADFGAGSGRWAKQLLNLISVQNFYIVEPSNAIEVAKNNLSFNENITYIKSTILEANIPEESLDFAYCLGVLHHTYDEEETLYYMSSRLKKGAPFLIYYYYNFENKHFLYKLVWKISDLIRKITSQLPFRLKHILSLIIATFIYFPLAKSSLVVPKKLRKNWPLSEYSWRSFYSMRTDALDRFGTKLERRKSKSELSLLLKKYGFSDLKFSSNPPYWCCLGIKK